MSAAAEPARVPIQPPPAVEPEQERPRHKPLRAIKIASSMALFLAGAYGVLNEQRSVSTGEAVVSAYAASVRTRSTAR
jgi:hypothetical protein